MPVCQQSRNPSKLTSLDRAVALLGSLSLLRLVTVVLNRVAEVEGRRRAVDRVVDNALDLQAIADNAEDAVDYLPAHLGRRRERHSVARLIAAGGGRRGWMRAVVALDPALDKQDNCGRVRTTTAAELVVENNGSLVQVNAGADVEEGGDVVELVSMLW